MFTTIDGHFVQRFSAVRTRDIVNGRLSTVVTKNIDYGNQLLFYPCPTLGHIIFPLNSILPQRIGSVR
jgi:hypothetical protein